MEKEEWRDVVGYEQFYSISNYGNLKSKKKETNNQYSNKETIINGYVNVYGYKMYCLTVKGIKKQFSSHRLVAISFIENPDKKNCVHHIDHNKLNNRVDNLQWVTYSENIKYNYLTGGQVGKTNMKGKCGELNKSSIKIQQLDLNGILIKEIIGISQAAREVNGSASHIVKVCNGKLNKHKGYKWKYA